MVLLKYQNGTHKVPKWYSSIPKKPLQKSMNEIVATPKMSPKEYIKTKKEE